MKLSKVILSTIAAQGIVSLLTSSDPYLFHSTLFDLFLIKNYRSEYLGSIRYVF